MSSSSTSVSWFPLFILLAAVPASTGFTMPSQPWLNSEARNMSPEHQLFGNLMKNYNKHIRPIMTHGEITSVFFELSLFDVLKLDTKNQVIVTNSEMIMKWQDNYLRWNPADYNGTTVIRIPYDDIWYPDIILQNTADADFYNTVLNTNAIITYDGEVELVSHGIFTSICPVDIQFYPFDQQSCELRFASWTYDEDQIRLDPGPPDLSEFTQNPEFFLEDFFYELKSLHNPCCKIPMSSLSYNIQLQRRTVFSLYFFIMPGILINMCALMVFSLPSESGEKIGLGINSLLAMMVFLMAMTEYLPPTQNLPLAGLYYGSCVTMIAMNIVLSVFVLNLNVMGMRGYQVPEILKVITVYQARLILVRIPIIVRESWYLEDEDEEEDIKVTPMENIVPEPIPPTPVEILNMDHNPYLPTRSPTPPPPPPPTVVKKDALIDKYDYSLMKDTFERRALTALESVNNILAREERGAKKTKKRANLIDEWKFVSRVLDRTLFILFTFGCFLFNILILTSSPFGERFSYCPPSIGDCEGMTFDDIKAQTAHAASNSHGGGGGGH